MGPNILSAGNLFLSLISQSNFIHSLCDKFPTIDITDDCVLVTSSLDELHKLNCESTIVELMESNECSQNADDIFRSWSISCQKINLQKINYDAFKQFKQLLTVDNFSEYKSCQSNFDKIQGLVTLYNNKKPNGIGKFYGQLDSLIESVLHINCNYISDLFSSTVSKSSSINEFQDTYMSFTDNMQMYSKKTYVSKMFISIINEYAANERLCLSNDKKTIQICQNAFNFFESDILSESVVELEGDSLVNFNGFMDWRDTEMNEYAKLFSSFYSGLPRSFEEIPSLLPMSYQRFSNFLPIRSLTHNSFLDYEIKRYMTTYASSKLSAPYSNTLFHSFVLFQLFSNYSHRQIIQEKNLIANFQKFNEYLSKVGNLEIIKKDNVLKLIDSSLLATTAQIVDLMKPKGRIIRFCNLIFFFEDLLNADNAHFPDYIFGDILNNSFRSMRNRLWNFNLKSLFNKHIKKLYNEFLQSDLSEVTDIKLMEAEFALRSFIFDAIDNLISKQDQHFVVYLFYKLINLSSSANGISTLSILKDIAKDNLKSHQYTKNTIEGINELEMHMESFQKIFNFHTGLCIDKFYSDKDFHLEFDILRSPEDWKKVLNCSQSYSGNALKDIKFLTNRILVLKYGLMESLASSNDLNLSESFITYF